MFAVCRKSGYDRFVKSGYEEGEAKAPAAKSGKDDKRYVGGREQGRFSPCKTH